MNRFRYSTAEYRPQQEHQDFNDRGALIRRLEREISCLERQLERLVMLDGNVDKRTQDTYTEMISSRKDMLSDLGF